MRRVADTVYGPRLVYAPASPSTSIAYASMRPSLRPAERRVDHLAATVVQPDQVLRARLGPAHRPLQRTRRPRDEHVLRVAADLRTEAAADVGRDHVHLLRLEREQPGERRLHRVRCLHAQPVVQPAVGVPRPTRRPDLRAGRPRAAARRCADGPRPRSRRTARRGRRPPHRPRTPMRCWCRPRETARRRRAPRPRGRARRAAARSRPRPVSAASCAAATEVATTAATGSPDVADAVAGEHGRRHLGREHRDRSRARDRRRCRPR